MRPEDAAHRIERIADAGAATALAAASAFACLAFVGSAAAGLAVGAAAFVIAWRALRCIAAAPDTLPLPRFTPAPLEIPDEPAELLLSDELPAPAPVPDELLLEDILEEIGPEARVVRLFAKPALPTAGELGAAIDRHLAAGPARLQPPDASDALLEALADLRRSLR